MTNQEAAQYNLQRAQIILDEAEHLRNQGAWNLVVRRCQETVELALKGALLWAGINVPHIHDVGGILVQHAERFPADLDQSSLYWPRSHVRYAPNERLLSMAVRTAACHQNSSTLKETLIRLWNKPRQC